MMNWLMTTNGIRRKFNKILLKYNVSTQPKNYNVFFDELLEHYREEFRAYHNWEHIRRMLKHINTLGKVYRDELTQYQLDALFIATVCHDAIYVLGTFRGENEQKTADYTRDTLLKYGICPSFALKVHTLIMNTIHDTQAVYGLDEKIIRDADLYEISTERFWINSEAIVQENLHKYIKEEIQEGQVQFMKMLLEKGVTLFHTDHMRKTRYDLAKQNIEDFIWIYDEI